MVNKIRIRNYMSLVKADIELGEITVIKGKSDSGKSAFFRAVKGAVSNQSGDDFITVGQDKCVVAIDNIAWVQSKKDNMYQIGSRKWEKCGRGVPDDVRSELNMAEFEFGKDVKLFLNFSGQLDRAFIVQGNPADNAKIIGSISNIHIIYNALREAEKDTKGIKKRITTVQEQSDGYKEQLDHYEPELERLDTLYAKMKDIYERAVKLDNEMSDIASLKARLISMADEAELRAQLAIHDAVCLEEDLPGRLDLIKKEMVELDDLKTESSEVSQELKNVQASQMLYEGIDFKKGYEVIDSLKVLSELKSQLQTVENAIGITKDEITDADQKVEGIRAQIDELDVCEVCGSSKEHWNV